ncbi:c-Myc-binding protein [Sitophilus oryzae]|uniref:c-Myc-binding protein n=1 Tax=Sitophilus oryzae TaxID=7048 RepID=A0A6J2XSQ1_SITOR|nr:c-Myc-binding protein [Sitophilus oryzae]
MSTANPSYKPSEGKREEFRKYLEKNGVMDALTKVLVNLYEEIDKPDDALEYIRDKLAVIAGIETYKQIQTKLMEAEEKIKELEGQIQPGGAAEEGVPLEGEGSATHQPSDEPAQVEGTSEKVPDENEPVVQEENQEDQ